MTSQANEAVENMKLLVRYRDANEPLPPDLIFWLSDAFQAYLEGRCASLNDAFALKRHARAYAQLVTRNEALRALAGVHFSSYRLSRQATRISELSRRYGTGRWRHDQHFKAMPQAYRGTVDECLWLAFKSGAAMPLGPRQLRTILRKRSDPEHVPSLTRSASTTGTYNRIVGR